MSSPSRFVEVITVRFTALATNSHGGNRPVSMLSRSHKSYGEKRTQFERLWPVKSPRMESSLTTNIPGSSRFNGLNQQKKQQQPQPTHPMRQPGNRYTGHPERDLSSRLLSSARLGDQVLASTDRVCAFTPVHISVDIFQSDWHLSILQP